MKIAIIGAGGSVGARITHEALSRGHSVTAIVHNPENLKTENEYLVVTKGDLMDPADIAVKIKGHDALVVLNSPDTDSSLYAVAAKAAIAAAKRAGVKRLINVGGAGSLYVSPAAQAVDTHGFPADWRPGAVAQRDTLDIYRHEKNLDWTYFSQADQIGPGERTGKYRLATDSPVKNEKGESRITYEDFAVALLDELENPQYFRKYVTIGY